MAAAAEGPFPVHKTLDVFGDFSLGDVHRDVVIRDVAEDSRKVKPGDLFLAPFLNNDTGLTETFVKDAVARGAAAVFLDSRCDSLLSDHLPIPIIPMENLVQKSSELGSIFYGEPSSKLKVVAVTGTNGKTSTSHVIAQALNLIGRKAAVIGTIGAGFIEERLVETGYTTPSPVLFQRLLKEFLDAGAESVAVEASSEGLAKRRMDDVRVQVGIFTNLSPEHLDFHGTMESYRRAKWRLFSDWPSLHTALINVDTEEGVHLAESLLGAGFDHIRRIVCFRMKSKTISLPCCSEKEVLHVFGEVEELSSQETRVFLETPWGSGRVRTRLIGRTNAYNLLPAVAILCCEFGVGFQEALAAISQVFPVPGRLELVCPKELHQLPRVFVDYAHCEKSLEGVLRDLKEVLPNGSRLICVFGCGGDRFRQKRALMGRLATEMAHSVVVTDDNPRFEDPEGIFADIRTGIDGRFLAKVRWEHDRRQAIELAIQSADPQDVVLIAGKGDESAIHKNGKLIPHRDSEVVQEILNRFIGGYGH